MFYRSKYNDFSEALTTSPEILAAIESLTGTTFERYIVDPGETSEHLDGEIAQNAAYQLWEEGGREDEILAVLPTEHEPPDGDEIFWGWTEKFAEFDGEKWIKT